MSNFVDLSNRMQENFNRITSDPNMRLFTVDLDKDELWNLYLDSFPEGTNEIYRVKREYDCSCCRHFIKSVGNVVYIDDLLNAHSIFEIDTGSEIFQPVMNAIANFVSGCPINGTFYSSNKVVGVPVSHWFNPDTYYSVTFNHFNLKLPDRFVVNRNSIKTIPNRIGDDTTNQRLFMRTMDDISMEALDTVLELIDSNNLYRGEEWKDILTATKLHKEIYSELTEDQHRWNYAWKISASAGPVLSRLRNHSIGTLLIDITSGVEIDEAVRMYEVIVAPSNYKRPKPIYTKKMLEEAEKKVAALGYYESLSRRFANANDINVRDILYIDRDALKSVEDKTRSIFDVMKDEVKIDDPRSFKNVETVNFSDFLRSDIFNGRKLYALFENRHAPNLMSLIAPANAGSKSMFKWNNGFSWAYNGNLTDSDIRENVKKAGGVVDAYMRFSIQWNDGNGWDKNDLDAHCIERIKSNGDCEIYYGDKVSDITGGRLDIDIIDPIKDEPAVENIYYMNKSQILPGTYDFFVVCYTNRGGTSGFRAELEIDGEIRRFDYKAPMNRSGMAVGVVRVVVDPNGNFKVEDRMPSSVSNRDIWGIKTNTFVPISMIMESPNYWGDNKVGNRHHMFILKGCVNPESPNGFYNEFLSNELIENRKVFEALGSRMSVPKSEDQLSGLGFSSTKRNDIIVKAVDENDKTQYVRVRF